MHISKSVLFLLICASPLWAREDADPEVVITLIDGTIAEGTLRAYAKGAYTLLSEGKEMTLPAKAVASIKTKTSNNNPADAEKFVIITMNDGSVVEGTLRNYADGEYVVVVDGEERSIALNKIATIKNGAPKEPEVKDGDPEPKGYMIIFGAEEDAKSKSGSWKKTSTVLRKRIEAMGVEEKSISSDKNNLIVRLNKIGYDFVGKLVSVVTARGELAVYVEAPMTELEKAKYKHPDAPEGRKWIALKNPFPPKYRDPLRKDPLGAEKLRNPETPSDDRTQLVFDKSVPLQTIVQSVEEKNGIITFTLSTGGMKLLQNLCKTDTTKLFLCMDGVSLRNFSKHDFGFARITVNAGEEETKLLKLYYDLPLTVEITAEVAPMK